MSEIQIIREQGYSAAYDRLIPDSGAIAMLLPQGESGTTLVVAVAGLNERIRENEKSILRLMRSTIKRYF
jgi:DNA-binding IclR family transcriptional regulator